MKQVTSIGEILFDVYPEEKNLGGAPFNFIYHIIKLTGSGNFISRVGNDELGREIIEFLKIQHISIDHIQVDDSHETGIARTVLDENKVPDFTIELNRAYDFIELSENINQLINLNTGCLYFGTLAQRELKSRQTIQSLLDRNIKYFCDLNIRQKFYSEDVLERSLIAADVLKINIDELKLLNDFLIKDTFELNSISEKLISKYEIDLLCVTRGSDGAILFQGKYSNNYNIKIDDIVDTVGAGDAYAAVLCIGYLEGWDIARINKLASEFAGEIVKVEGALPKDESIYKKFKEKIKNE